MQDKVAHLQMIQDTVGRMSSNSMTLKTLAVTVVGAIIALAASQAPASDPTQSVDSTSTIILSSLLPVALFWLLDAYYLGIERAYRKLFDHIRGDGDTEPFSMDFRPYWGGLRGTLEVAIFTPVLYAYPAVMAVVFFIWWAR